MSCGEAESQHAATILTANREKVRPCKFCEQPVVWGLTRNGRAAPFDPDTRQNHWVLCLEAAAARKERDRLYVKDAAIIRKNVVEVLRQLDSYERGCNQSAGPSPSSRQRSERLRVGSSVVISLGRAVRAADRSRRRFDRDGFPP